MVASAGYTYIEYQGALSPYGVWAFVCAIQNGDSSANMKLYLNAVEQTPQYAFTNGTRLSDAGNGGMIGWSATNVSNDLFKGNIDDVRIYNRALTTAEIASLYNTGTATANASTNALNASGLVGQWSFDGKNTNWTSSTTGTVADTSGNSNTGTLTSMSRATSPVTGKIGQALNFDGTSQYVGLGNPVSLQLAGSHTISTWFNSSYTFATLPAPTPIVAKRLLGSNCSYGLTITYEVGSALQVYAQASSDGTCAGGATAARRYNATAINANQWYHIVGVYNASNQTLDTYLNGVLDNGTLSGTIPASIYNSPQDATIGAYDTGGYFFGGKIDDTRIYNRALSASEVASLYNSGR
jgi:hypothetical protein